MLPWSNTELEQLLRTAVLHGAEGSKFDLKRELVIAVAADKVEFAKDVSAIANTDVGDNIHRGYGFIVLGAEPGKIVGGVGALRSEKRDNTSAAISQVLKE